MAEPLDGGPLARRNRRVVSARANAPLRGRDLYQQYLTELDAYPLLTADAELALARTIDTCEREVWLALLSDPAQHDRVAAAWSAHAALPPAWVALRREAHGRAATPEVVQQLTDALLSADAGRVVRRAVEHSLLAQGEPPAPPHAGRVALARKRHRAAVSRMVTANLRLVVSLAKRYGAPRLLSAGDFVQEGNLGLLRAVETFDPERGVRFATYAAWWIRHAFNRALSDRGRLVRVPESVLEETHRVSRAHRGFVAREGAAPSPDQLALEAGVPVDRVEALLAQAMSREPVSLDAEVGLAERPMIDRLAADIPDITVQLDAATFAQTILPLFAGLTVMEAEVLRLRFGLDGDEPLTLREVGDKHGLTRERIRQLQEKALAKLRDALAGPSDAPASPARRPAGGRASIRPGSQREEEA